MGARRRGTASGGRPSLEQRQPWLALCMALAWAVASVLALSLLVGVELVPHADLVDPFYHRATLSEDAGDVTLATHLSFDHLDGLVRLAWRWQGPISAALYLSPAADEAAVALAQLDALLGDVQAVRRWVDVHLVREEDMLPTQAFSLYPANLLRNVAVHHSRTDAVLCLDVDLVPDPRMHSTLRALVPQLNEALKEDRPLALVIPTVEVNEEVTDVEGIPFELRRVQELYRRGVANAALLEQRPLAHEATGLERWARAVGAGQYAADYHLLYEPFTLVDRRQAPAYDEEMRGYGPDRAAHAYIMAAQGYEFRVVQEAFAVHMPLEASTWSEEELSPQFLWMPFVATMRRMEAEHGRYAAVPDGIQERICHHNPECVRFWEWI